MNALTYKPLTATPYKHNETYTEMLPANPELAKYIRCFWGINDASFCYSADGYVKKSARKLIFLKSSFESEG